MTKWRVLALLAVMLLILLVPAVASAQRAPPTDVTIADMVIPELAIADSGEATSDKMVFMIIVKVHDQEGSSPEYNLLEYSGQMSVTLVFVDGTQVFALSEAQQTTRPLDIGNANDLAFAVLANDETITMHRALVQISLEEQTMNAYHAEWTSGGQGAMSARSVGCAYCKGASK